MARMGDERRPVPRFEIVHSGADQAWHARFIGGNGESVWSTENYADVRDAERAVALLVEALGSQAMFEGVKARKDAARPGPVPVLRVEVAP